MSDRMPFGRYRGLPLADLPADYLAWLDALPDLQPRLRAAVSREQARRRGRTHAPPRAQGPMPDGTVCAEIVSAGLRSVARRYHPDAGGTHDQMIAATAAADWLRAQVRSLSC
jgi:hypothetical protein